MRNKTIRYYYHLLGRLKLEGKTIPSVGKDVGQLESSYLLVEMQTKVALCKYLAISYKVIFSYCMNSVINPLQSPRYPHNKNVYVQKKKKVKSDPFEKGQGWRRNSERSLVGKNVLNNLAGKEK